MEKRTLLALLLVFILFLVFNQFVWKPQQLRQQQEQQNQQTQTPQTVTEPVIPDTIIITPMPDTLLAKEKTPEIIKLSNQLMTVTFNSRGGSIQQVELHNFIMHDSTKVKLIPENSSLADVKLIHPAAETPLKDVIFQYKISPDSLGVTFFLGDETNPQISKSFALDNQYGISFAINVENYQVINGIEVDFSCGIADTETVTKSKQQDYRFMYYADNEIFKTTLAKMKKKQPSGNLNSFNWMALRGKYFTLVLKENEPALMRSFRTE
nr:membrane protein insertase YidC [Candidatus Cloacimonas acidaminovorans]